MYQLIRIIRKEKEEEISKATEINEERLVNINSASAEIDINGRNAINRRITGELQDKAFCLSNSYYWILGIDSQGFTVLVPVKKE